MSIASEISRLQGAKADIKTAIEGKGVTVPSATKLDGYADLVDAIPQGSTPTGTKQISVTANGTQTESVSGYASAQLNVAVPNSYSASDEGKVVSNGALVAQTSDTVTENDTYDTTLINSLTVNVSGGGGTDFIDYLENSLTEVNLPTLTKLIKTFAFRNSIIESAVFLNVTTFSVGPNAFSDNTHLKLVSMPKIATLGGGNTSSAFSGDSNLETIEVGNWRFGDNEMNGCTKLKTIIIRHSSVVQLAATSAFTNTPFASGGSGGTIYVPSSLIDSYKAASNWSTINGYGTITWKAIEGSYYETHYADGTPIS